MEYKSSIKTLLETFPELIKEYEENRDYLENLQHLVFSIIFVPYIVNSICNNVSDQIEKISMFLEEMLQSPDELTQELAVVSILEPLLSGSDYNITIKARKYFGLITNDYVNRIEIAFGWKK